MSDLDIAAMSAADLDGVMEIERLAFRSPWSRQVFVEELDRDFAHVDVLKERETGRVLAFCNYWLVHDKVHILNIATHPSERRRGHAERLMRKVLGIARTRAVRCLTLEVRRSNLAALRLYRRFGFRPVAIRVSYYAEDGEDAVVMLREGMGGEGA